MSGGSATVDGKTSEGYYDYGISLADSAKLALNGPLEAKSRGAGVSANYNSRLTIAAPVSVQADGEKSAGITLSNQSKATFLGNMDISPKRSNSIVLGSRAT